MNDKLKKWENNEKLVIGVSSFGIGGTNAHVIIEEPPHIKNENSTAHNESVVILPISAKSKTSLRNRKKQLFEFLSKNYSVSLNNVAKTLWTGREYMPFRTIIIANSVSDILADNYDSVDNKYIENITGFTFMFPGQGAQYVNMGKSLYNGNTVFKEIVEQGFEIFQGETGIYLRDILFPQVADEDSEKALTKTSITQPVLFIIEFALAKVLIDEKITPKIFNWA